MAKKKSFVESAHMQDDPALSFISKESVAMVEETEGDEITVEIGPLPGEARARGRTEAKTRRVQLVMQPSLYRRVREASCAEGLSVNEYCHRVLEDAVAKSGDGV